MSNVHRRWAELVALAVAYCVAGWLGMFLAIPPDFATAVWPASGIALAGTLLCGYRVWPAVLLGSFLVNLLPALETTGTDPLLPVIGLAASTGVGASLQAIVGAFLIRRFVEQPTAFVETRDVVKFLLLGGPLSSLVNATWGVTGLLLAGVLQPADYLFHWWTWWVGDAVGVITVTPMIVMWATKPALVSRYRQIAFSLCLVFTVVVICFIYTLQESRLNLQGYVSGAFRVSDAVNTSLQGHDADNLELRLLDNNGGEIKQLLYPHRSPLAGSTDRRVEPAQAKSAAALKQTLAFEVADRRSLIEFAPTKEYLMTRQGWPAWSVLAGGLFLTGLFGAFRLIITSHAAKLQGINAELDKQITERKLAQDKFTKLAVIVDSLDEAIIAATWDGIVTAWNKGAEVMYGYAADEMIGRSISILHPAHLPNEFRRLRAQLEQGEPVAQQETVRLRKDRTEIPVAVTLSVTKDAAEIITGVVSVSRDISARKRAEAALQRHRQGVAHRLHDSVLQSLNAISLHLKTAQILLTEKPQMARQHLADIENVLRDEQQNLRLFVRELKGARLAKPIDDSCGMTVLKMLVKRLESQWSIRIEIEVEPGVGWIPTDLVENLVYLIQEGVSNAVRHGQASIVQLQIRRMGEKLVVRIFDNGSGFPFRNDDFERTATATVPSTLQSRIATLGGLLNIRCADAGACVEMILPLSCRGGSDADHVRYLG